MSKMSKACGTHVQHMTEQCQYTLKPCLKHVRQKSNIFPELVQTVFKQGRMCVQYMFNTSTKQVQTNTRQLHNMYNRGPTKSKPHFSVVEPYKDGHIQN